jgi:serine/threonine protein kinase
VELLLRGTVPYMALELLMGDTNQVTTAVDMYSFGVSQPRLQL